MTFPSRGDTTLSAWAHAYAEQGWPVFPCIPRDKRPIPKNGFHAATTDHDVIAAWWRDRPDANIGLPTGQAFDVLDIDGPEGVRTINRFWGERDLIYRHAGPVSLTGKGYHMLFAVTGRGNGAALLGPDSKLDFRGLGGYIVAPPSIHPLGHRYTWDRARDWTTPLPEPTPWLLEMLDRRLTSVVIERKPIPVIAKDIDIEMLRQMDRGQQVAIDNPTAQRRIGFRERSIIEVCVEKHIELRPRGSYHVGRCPFHPDDTPSFAVYPANNTFYCYGCQAHGDSYDLLNDTHI